MLEVAGADFIIDNFKELPGVIKKIENQNKKTA